MPITPIFSPFLTALLLVPPQFPAAEAVRALSSFNKNPEGFWAVFDVSTSAIIIFLATFALIAVIVGTCCTRKGRCCRKEHIEAPAEQELHALGYIEAAAKPDADQSTVVA
ncbi:hypothetical protein PRIPAC_79947 [Pristionchus pacificus]|uniref:Uncharacterized protein n=1 Tax=Pristionchus pacificus TaxID=54126 RepID=A0A2A6CLZ5_PRIPA|nr:hypothetical protein PRIPAC_79947 [Pristionchus pacificus]|eukprot:PDM79265.1 hypothetical protein PRIPAC_31844 [Pristionchus pacificus]